ncbi:hypothetical protein [Kitasatospora sp. NRRL B-11411]|uniref:hypothetical protein n=1 Tax=Kitasatospora sp. NRRL B-11411 TaxID=1463822 RepID=UPI0009DE20CC|nr:hypothetical protein [Kitasatospora sp. NRRL B-11411]
MPSSPQPFKPGGQSLMVRRVLAGLVAVVAVALVAGLIARFTSGGHRSQATSSATSTATPGPAPSSTSPTAPNSPAPAPTGTATSNPVAPPPHTNDPVVFAKAFAQALWTYDARTASQSQQLAGLRTWLTGESKYADPAALAGQVPDPTLWDRMRDNGQFATGKVNEAHLPTAFNQAVAADPTKLTVAYVYAVTVTGSQSITWTGGGRGDEQRAITIAVQCRPGHDCALASIAPTVYP